MHQTTLRRGRCRWPSLCSATLLSGATLAGLLIWSAREIPAELKGPKTNDRYVTQMVAVLLEKDHLSRQRLNDVIARRGLEMYLEILDPLKVYFLQADVDEFRQERDQLDDRLIRGDITFAYKVFDRYRERMNERIQDIDTILAAEPDYSADEELATDLKSIPFPKDAEEARDRLRRRIKYELMARKADKEDVAEVRDSIARRYRNFAKRREQTDSDELLEMYLSAMTSSYDPHTTYMSPDSLENFHINMKLNLEGIGAALQVKDGYTVVSKVITGGAADKLGKLKPEDRIVSVGQGEEGEMVDVIDMKLADVVKLIRGKADTVVRLGVVHTGTTETEIYPIVRARIELKDAEARAKVFDETRTNVVVEKDAGGRKWKIGVVDLPGFYMDMTGARQNLADFKSTTRDVSRILAEFKQQGVEAVVLDLRRNGGGSLTEAINLTGLFIDQGPVVQVKDSDGSIQHYNDHQKGMAWDGPLVVVTDKFSASASEILAGAIQDYRRGILVGDEATHGKGTVQSLLDLGSQLHRRPDAPNYGALKITMQQFYRPSGQSTQNRGVLTDIALPSVITHMDIGESDLDYALEFDNVSPAIKDADKLAWVNGELLAELRSRSEERRRHSEDFQKLVKKIERYREQKERKSVSLNEEKFLAELAVWDAETDQEKELAEQFDADRPVFPREDFYNNEVIAIALDYLELLGTGAVAQVTEGKVNPGGS